MFFPLNLPLSVIIIWVWQWFRLSFQYMCRPSLTTSRTYYPRKDMQKAIVSNASVESSSLFYSLEFDFDQSSSAISPIIISWLNVTSNHWHYPLFPQHEYWEPSACNGSSWFINFFHLLNRWPLYPNILQPLPMYCCNRWNSAALNPTVADPATSLLSAKCPDSEAHIPCQLYPWLHWCQWQALVFWC